MFLPIVVVVASLVSIDEPRWIDITPPPPTAAERAELQAIVDEVRRTSENIDWSGAF